MRCGQISRSPSLRIINSIKFFLLLLILSSTQLRFNVEAGRPNPKLSNEEKMAMRGRLIGSRPPKCERMCSWCRDCEAVQIPTNPQIRNSSPSPSPSRFYVDLANYYARRDDSNYKPMSWKCKCGNFIFNP
ncbi:hypothetical protein ACFE04_002509 [Oxalis oulophora]